MSAKPESVFIRSVHKLLKNNVHYEKMANPYRGGTPDCWYSGNKGDLWIEYKFVVPPKKDSARVKINLSPLQRRWLDLRYKEGRNVAVVVGCKGGGMILKNGLWNCVHTAKHLRECLVPRLILANWIERETTG